MRNYSRYAQINNKKTKVILFLSMLVLLFVLNACSKYKVPEENAVSKNFVIRFEDKNLEVEIRKALKKPEGAITTVDAANVTELDLSKRVMSKFDSYKVNTSDNIKSLEGLEYFINLEKLNLRGNNIADITPLMNLEKLRELDLSCNFIRNIEPLNNLQNLEKLDVSWNGLSDVSFLEKLTHLKEFLLGRAIIFAPVDYIMNNISDISVIKDMKNLETVDLDGLDIKELDVLKEMRKLKKLVLANNRISSIDCLKDCVELEYLDIRNNQLKDITPLERLIMLEYLYLSENGIDNIDALKNLTELKELNLNNNFTHSVEALIGITKLRKLMLDNNKLEEISALANMTSLEELTLTNNFLVEIDVLGGLKRIKILNLYGNKIENIKSIKELTSLERLEIGNNPVTEYSPLEGLKNASISGVTIPLFKEPDRIDVPENLEWNPYTREYYDSSEFIWDVDRQSYIERRFAEDKSDNNLEAYNCSIEGLPAIQINENNTFFTNEGVTLSAAKEQIAEYIIAGGAKGDVKANLKIKEISVKEAWDSDRMQIYRVDIDYRWLHGVAVIRDGKVLCVLDGMPTYEVFLGDVDGDGSYEIYSNVAFGSGIVSDEIRGYNISSSKYYTLSMRMQRDLKLFVQDKRLYVKQFEPMSYNQDCVEINRLIIKNDDTLGIDF